jgi:hypothetical protein
VTRLNEIDTSRFQFSELCEALAIVDVKSVSADYGHGGLDFGRFFRREIFPRLRLSEVAADPHYVKFDGAEAMETLSPYTILRLLAANPVARDLRVNWAFGDIEEGGYASLSQFVRPLDKWRKFLIVTEGSSDATIIKHGFAILRPHIADFFDFVDMEEGYPFSGTGNLFRFVQGLISIGIQNKVIVIFDNDAEGVASFNRCRNLNVPMNMKVLKLPDIPAFLDFETVGPNGTHRANINGQAAAIECYLDIRGNPRVRWNNYNPAADAYQGELIGKDRYKRVFLDQQEKTAGYDYGNLELILDMIVGNCIQMQELILDKEIEEQSLEWIKEDIRKGPT